MPTRMKNLHDLAEAYEEMVEEMRLALEQERFEAESDERLHESESNPTDSRASILTG